MHVPIGKFHEFEHLNARAFCLYCKIHIVMVKYSYAEILGWG